MKLNIKTTVLGTILVAATGQFAFAADLDITPAPAEVVDVEKRFYGKIYGGVAFVRDEDFDGTVTGPVLPGGAVVGAPFTVNLDSDAGFTVGGSVGYRFTDVDFGGVTPRIEFDVNYTSASAGQGSAFAAGNQVFNGNQSLLFIGANGLLDFDPLGNGVIVPYVGGGVGVGLYNSDVAYFPAANPAVNVILDSSEAAFAAQAIVGAQYNFTDSLAFSVEGRYLRAFGLDADRVFTTAPGPGLFGVAEGDFSAITINGGLTYRF